MKHISDDTIVRMLKSGDPLQRNEVMTWLYQKHYGTIIGYIISNSGTEDDAADIFQDSLVIFYLKVRKGTYQNSSSVGTFLYAVSKNLWLKKLRRARFDFSKLEVEESYDLDEDALTSDSLLTVQQAMKQIGENCQQLLTDFYFKKLTMRELMENYGLGSESAAKNKKYRCLQRLITFVREKKLKKSDFRNE